MKRAIAVLTRYPVPGRCKTRLVPLLGEEGAGKLHKILAEHAVSVFKAYSSNYGADLFVFYSGAGEHKIRKWLGQDIACFQQPSGDLGKKMASAFKTTFRKGYRRTLVLGTDCPDVDEKVLNDAFSVLEHRDIVIGPAEDGGYYLIGLKQEASRTFAIELFQDIPWGSAEVLKRTAETAGSLKLNLGLLPVLPDVDRPEDLLNPRNTHLAALLSAAGKRGINGERACG